ncbi:formylglycine-generating enzyme family protein [Microbacterium murale]|uniref:Sulfatase modifying factor 1 n=1 Tax=Microbacterium murale TaxID=1081040 RepID=A0ABU0PA55_9MICO|nr:formylglycine-generating enzyme family protein [Microbacterium murale]MDQ0644210.1 sulfatase modifying factor 1 [Microbacterium murale]
MTSDAECGPGCTCGAPGRDQFVALGMPSRETLRASTAGRHDLEQAVIPAGTFTMGDSSGDLNPVDGEVPRHPVTLPGFSIDTTAVTNDAFARFVDATGYTTEAEAFGYSAVFHLALTAPEEDIVGVPSGTPWWLGVRGADWRHPGGGDSSIDGRGDHPVVHVSWNDAVAYAGWVGRRLPSEAEWEYAARGGIEGAKYPWGDDEVDAGGWRANIWQGEFPRVNTVEDGFLSTAPVRTFEPNGYGLWQSVGNVWEWCQDWFDPNYYGRSPAASPTGPDRGQARVLRGGSYLCHISYCNRYRNSARSQNTPDSSMSNSGFRTVAL